MPIKKDNRTLRIGVLGCGPIAQIGHFDACVKARNAQLYAICDIADDLRAKMEAVWDPRVSYASYERMLEDPQVEAVIIAVADQFHVPLAIQALKAGKHVLVEKPLGTSIEECEALCAVRQASGLVLQVGNNRRFDPGIVFARKFVEEQIGERMGYKGWYRDSVYRYTMTDNLQANVRTSGAVVRPEGNPKANLKNYYLLGHASHLVDTTRFLGREIRSVRARLLERFGAFCWFVDVDFEDGSLGTLDLTIPLRGDFEEGFTIFGEFGSVEGRVFLPWFHKTSIVECFSTRDQMYRRPMGQDAYTYKLQIEGFADTILEGAPQHGAGAVDGLHAVRALVAIARSVESGEPVILKDVKGGL